MADDHDDLEGRVSALEHEMRQVRQDAAAARVLAGGADRDVSTLGAKLDAHTRTMNALRETQLEHGERLSILERKVDNGFTEMRGKLDAAAAGQQQVVTLLTTSSTSSLSR